MSSGFQITKQTQTVDPSPEKTIIQDWEINDISDLTGKTPFDALLSEEERAQIGGEDYLIKADVTSSLMSYIFKPVKGYIPSPYDVAFRCFILAYVVNASIINSMTLKQIGELFGTSKQTASARLVKVSNELNIRCRAQKGTETVKKFSDIGKERWKLKKEEERREYMRQYRADHREELNARHKEYYAENREDILKRRKIKRDKERKR